jgi:hypothetical protein
VAGFSFAGSGQNTAMCFVRLKDWSVRKSPDMHVKAIAGRAMAAFSQYRDAQVFAFSPPAVMELGNAAGFDFELQDMAGLGHEKLMAARNQLLGMAGSILIWPWCAPTAWTTRRSTASTSTGTRQAPLACRVGRDRTSSPRPGAAPTSTTSWTRGASRRSSCRARRPTA